MDELDSEYYAVYGSLRQGFWNWDWSFNVAPLAITRVQGYHLRDNGGFPAAFEDKESSVVVEIYDTSQMDREIVRSVDGMEFGCGYFKRLVRTDNDMLAWMFVMPEEYGHRFDTPVPDGDWIAFQFADQMEA